MKRFLNTIYILIFFGLIVQSLHAAEIEGTYYEDDYIAGDTKLRLVGTGLLRYWGFKAYTGALYLEEGVAVEDVLSDTAKRIELEYFRAINGQDFGPATDKSIAKNVDTTTVERIRSQIDFHNSLYEDVKPGDRYALTYIPGRGTELALNGNPKGIIEGDEFAAAIFSIWLGPKPISKTFKRQIMGR